MHRLEKIAVYPGLTTKLIPRIRNAKFLQKILRLEIAVADLSMVNLTQFNNLDKPHAKGFYCKSIATADSQGEFV